MLLTMQLGKYSKAIEKQVQFIQAFDLMEQRLRASLHMEIETLKEILPFDPKGTISKVNQLPRDKNVRSYYRSKNGKELQTLDNNIKKLQNKLGGFFDAEIICEIEAVEVKRLELLKP